MIFLFWGPRPDSDRWNYLKTVRYDRADGTYTFSISCLMSVAANDQRPYFSICPSLCSKIILFLCYICYTIQTPCTITVLILESYKPLHYHCAYIRELQAPALSLCLYWKAAREVLANYNASLIIRIFLWFIYICTRM